MADLGMDKREEDEELFEHHRLVVDPGQEAIRLDKYLMDKLQGTSRNRIQNGIKNGFVKIDDKEIIKRSIRFNYSL